MNQINQNKKFFLSLLFFLGYLSLVGPPRAISMKKSLEKDPSNELYGQPVWVVVIVELAIRGGIFIVLATGIEFLLGNEVFETVYGDEILIGLMLCGVVHVLAYYFGLIIIAPKSKNIGMTFYRLGRNVAYSLFIGILSVSGFLFYQYVNNIKIVRVDVFMMLENIFILFVLIGIIETILKVSKTASTIDL